jgi:hypothetical protein
MGDFHLVHGNSGGEPPQSKRFANDKQPLRSRSAWTAVLEHRSRTRRDGQSVRE